MSTRKRRSLDDQLAKRSAPAEALPMVAEPVVKARGNSQPGGRSGKKAISGFFEIEVSRQLKMIAVSEDKTVQSLMGEALNLLFEKYGKDAIAQTEE